MNDFLKGIYEKIQNEKQLKKTDAEQKYIDELNTLNQHRANFFNTENIREMYDSYISFTGSSTTSSSAAGKIMSAYSDDYALNYFL